MEVYQDIKRGEKGAWVSIGAYVFLSLLKISVGYEASSEALIADGFNNGTDILVSIAVLVGLFISRKPPDSDHRYGHFRAQTIAQLIASFIMIFVGVEVLIQAVQSMITPKTSSPDLMAGWTALFCAAFMYGIYRYNLSLAKRINNQALMAAAKDNRSDAFVSLGAFVGILGAQLQLPWLDTVAAFGVGVIICKTGWEISYEATHHLTDGFDEKELTEYERTISRVGGVHEVKEVRARKHGNVVLLDVTIAVDSKLNVVESHTITEEIESVMNDHYGIPHVFVHIEPHH
ncbi:cation diffusion facilitator family transporter [Tumebacillus sp. DT12]|uniref:Cation diffusion facilitator family transporter n=1 Tax=Tumebacillus lacus TaxID=2995335 RepID=A0ABT3X5M4_9BACL|nr:cation diffusion facilitator family transporter [Tumebacillus lacus]MCX7572206.1 cation diffusion facilitator family transporter [Tumebacillus lacus]